MSRFWRSSRRARPAGRWPTWSAHGITEQTYYRWQAKYGGLERSELQRIKQLEDENRRLKHIVAEQMLDIQALRAVVEKSGNRSWDRF